MSRVLASEHRIFEGVSMVEEAQLLMEKAQCYLQLQQPDMALRNLDRIALYALGDSLRNEVLALRESCQPATALETSSPDVGSFKPKNPETAKWLSLLPGCGHFYSGAIGEGCFSMLLNAIPIAFIVLELQTPLYLGAFLGGGIMLVQPYLGGTERAIQLVYEYNARGNNKVASQTYGPAGNPHAERPF